MSTAAAPPAAPPRERVLVVANDYPGQPWALPEVAAEADAYERILAEAGVAFATLRNLTAAQFRAALVAQRPTAVVFCGHGDLQHDGGMALGFVSAQGDGARFDLVDHATMADYLLAQPTLRLVLLTACCTEMLARQMARLALRRGRGAGAAAALPCIACWRTMTADRAARAFGEAFVRHFAQAPPGSTAWALQAYAAATGAVTDLRVPSTLGTGHAADVICYAFEDPATWGASRGATWAAGVPLLVDLQRSARALAAAAAVEAAAARPQQQLHAHKTRRFAVRAAAVAR